MGLDSYFVRWEKDGWSATGLKFPEYHLCGGMFSGAGGSFRGKVYSEFIEAITGIHLYQEEIGPKTVTEMAHDLRAELKYHAGKDADTEIQGTDSGGYPVTYGELVDLVSLFEFASEQGLTLVGWW